MYFECTHHIPEEHKYGTPVAGLIKVMLGTSPEAQPDIMQARTSFDWLSIHQHDARFVIYCCI